MLAAASSSPGSLRNSCESQNFTSCSFNCLRVTSPVLALHRPDDSIFVSDFLPCIGFASRKHRSQPLEIFLAHHPKNPGATRVANNRDYQVPIKGQCN